MKLTSGCQWSGEAARASKLGRSILPVVGRHVREKLTSGPASPPIAFTDSTDDDRAAKKGAGEEPRRAGRSGEASAEKAPLTSFKEAKLAQSRSVLRLGSPSSLWVYDVSVTGARSTTACPDGGPWPKGRAMSPPARRSGAAADRPLCRTTGHRAAPWGPAPSRDGDGAPKKPSEKMRFRPAAPVLEAAAVAAEALLGAVAALAAGPPVGRSLLATSASRNCWEQRTPPWGAACSKHVTWRGGQGKENVRAQSSAAQKLPCTIYIGATRKKN